MERIRKKGFVFSMDAFFAIVLFLVITLGIYSYFISFYSLQQQWYMSEDLMDVLLNTKIGELDLTSGLYPNIEELSNSGVISKELSIADQINELVKNNQVDEAKRIAEDLVNPLRGSRFGVTISIEDMVDPDKKSEVYTSTGTEKRLGLTTSQRYVMGNK